LTMIPVLPSYSDCAVENNVDTYVGTICAISFIFSFEDALETIDDDNTIRPLRA